MSRRDERRFRSLKVKNRLDVLEMFSISISVWCESEIIFTVAKILTETKSPRDDEDFCDIQ